MAQRWFTKRAAQWGLAVSLASAALVQSGVADADQSCGDIAQGRCTLRLSTGIDMAYVETGPAKGHPVILIHGLTDSIRSWSLSMRDLHERDPSLHILAIDLRGQGKSSLPPAAQCAAAPEACFQMKDFAGDVVAFMQAKHVAKATLVGHSMGTFIVQEIALTHPAMVDHAILLATSSTGVNNAALRDYVLKEPVEGSWKAALEAKGKAYPKDVYLLAPRDIGPSAVDWIAKNWVVDPAADPAFLKPYVPETAAVRFGLWIGATKALLTTDNTVRLKDMAVPTLVLWATQDSIFLDTDQVAIRGALAAAVKQHGTVAYWKAYGALPLPASGQQETDIGHNIQWAAHDAVAADIKSFIKSDRPTMDLVHSKPAPNVTSLVTEPGKAKVIHIGF